MSSSSALSHRGGGMFQCRPGRFASRRQGKRSGIVSRAAAGFPMEMLESRTMLTSSPLIYASPDIPKAITGYTPVTSTMPVTAPQGAIVDVNVGVNLTHGYDGSLLLTLVSPSGTRVTLSQYNGGSGDNFTDTVFDDQASLSVASGVAPFTGSFRPESALSTLNGEQASGSWQLVVSGSGMGSVGTLNSWTLSVTLAGPPPQVGGYKWNDLNRNGVRDTNLVTNGRADIVYAIDVSRNATDPATGMSVGDVNNDGMSDTLLDVQIAALMALNQDLINRGLGTDANVSVVVYAEQAQSLDMNPTDGQFTAATSPAADLNTNGTPDVYEVLTAVTAGHGGVGYYPSYEKALQQVISTYDALETAQGAGSLVFVATDYSMGGTYSDEVQALTARGVNMRAFGIGASSSSFFFAYSLQQIDSRAQIFTTSDAMINVFGKGAGLATFTEPGMAGWRIYIDTNENGAWDYFEPSALTDVNGDYGFVGLRPGTYTVREVPQVDWDSSYPEDESYTVTISEDSNVPFTTANFGNYQPGRIRGFAWNDTNRNGVRDTDLYLGRAPDIILAIDVSSGADLLFPNATVGDVNLDGVANTMLDVQLASAIALNKDLMNRGVSNVRLAVLAYSDEASFVDFLPLVPDSAIAIRPSQEIEDALISFRPARRSGTVVANPAVAIDAALAGFQTMATPRGSANLLLFGQNPDSVTIPAATASLLSTRGVNTHAFAVGAAGPVTALQPADADAMLYADDRVLVGAMMGQTLGTNIHYTEFGIPEIRYFLDLDNDESFDYGEEPFTLTDSEGNYEFNRLDFGTYTVRQSLTEGWSVLTPAGGASTAVVSPIAPTPPQFFGNVQTASVLGTAFKDRNGNRILDLGEPTIAGATIYVDANNNRRLDAGELSTTTDDLGSYNLMNLAPGTYNIREVAPAGLSVSSPLGGAHRVVVGAGQVLVGRDFANRQPTAEMALFGGGRAIANHSTIPVTSNRTDMGAANVNRGTRSAIFTIRNIGTASLLLNGRPRVTIAGANAADFKVVTQPRGTVVPTGYTSFKIVFDPRAVGRRTAQVIIRNNAPGQNPFSFAIRGNGTGTLASAQAKRADAAVAAPRAERSLPARSGLTASLFSTGKRITELA